MHHQLADSGARILVTVPPLAATAARACAGIGVTEVYLLGQAGEPAPISAPGRRGRSGCAGRR